MTYSEKLKDPRWQKKRLEILERDSFACQCCYSIQNELHVHHRNYRRAAEPWDYDDSELITLCSTCHKALKELQQRINKLITNDLCFGALSDLCDVLESSCDNSISVSTILSILAHCPRLIEPTYQLLSDRFSPYPQVSTSRGPQAEQEAVK